MLAGRFGRRMPSPGRDREARLAGWRKAGGNFVVNDVAELDANRCGDERPTWWKVSSRLLAAGKKKIVLVKPV